MILLLREPQDAPRYLAIAMLIATWSSYRVRSFAEITDSTHQCAFELLVCRSVGSLQSLHARHDLAFDIGLILKQLSETHELLVMQLRPNGSFRSICALNVSQMRSYNCAECSALRAANSSCA